MDGPPGDAYSRVTEPGRYAVLHDAAGELLDDLTERYIVERRESGERLDPAGEPVRVVRLIPRTPDAATMAVAFTAFPGLVVRFGRWYEQALPSCGCDACDEQPTDLIAELHRQTFAVVEGGLWERVRRRVGGSWSETRLIGRDVSAGRGALLAAQDARAARREGFAAPVRWAPWPCRSGPA
jgi:hypothetical protein